MARDQQQSEEEGEDDDDDYEDMDDQVRRLCGAEEAGYDDEE